MRPIATDEVAWSVSLSVTTMSPAKMAEPIEMPFGLWTLVLDRIQIHGIALKVICNGFSQN